jgi:hypothetical protein
MKLARKIQAERKWGLTRAWAEASQQRPDLMSGLKTVPEVSKQHFVSFDTFVVSASA